MANQERHSFHAGPGVEEHGTYTTGYGRAYDPAKGTPTMASSQWDSPWPTKATVFGR